MSTTIDERISNALPRHTKARAHGCEMRGSAVWHADLAADLEVPGVPGVYPKGFLEWALRAIGAGAHEVLHMCSGSLPRGAGGVRVDLRNSQRPTVVADARRLPFADESFAAALCDPPYSVEYAKSLYGTDYPRPSHLLAEASRVLMPGGVVGFLHFLVPPPVGDLAIERVYGITTGPLHRIRAFTVLRKHGQSRLFR